ncbi:MAG: pilus assembly protein [Alphaproteobacteria bacterium]|nr:pilus assembly protein [Alphaproteobacteria bacterium]
MTSRHPATLFSGRPMAALRRLRQEKSGVAAVEFAIILPLLLLLLVGVYDICAGVVAYRKATLAARSISSIIASSTAAVTTSAVDDAFRAAGLVMDSLTGSENGLFIYKVNAANSCLDWSYSTPAGQQAAANPPDGLIRKGDTGFVIMTRVTYRFNPIPDKLFGVFDAALTLTGNSYALPLQAGTGFTYPSLKKC